MAIENGHLEVMKTLLKDNRVNFPAVQSNDAIQKAKKKRHWEVVKALQDWQARSSSSEQKENKEHKKKKRKINN